MLHRIPVLKLLHIPRAQCRHFRTISGVGLEPLFGSNTSPGCSFNPQRLHQSRLSTLQPRSSFARVRCGRVPGGIAVAARASRLMRRQIPSCHSCTTNQQPSLVAAAAVHAHHTSLTFVIVCG